MVILQETDVTIANVNNEGVATIPFNSLTANKTIKLVNVRNSTGTCSSNPDLELSVQVNPLLTPVAALGNSGNAKDYCNTAFTVGDLPTSDNGIDGTWSTSDTSTPFTYEFTPDSDECVTAGPLLVTSLT